MSDLASSISGLFGRAIISASFLPAAIFVLLGWVFLGPLIPTNIDLLQQVRVLDSTSQVITTAVISIVLTVLLHNLNIPLVRLYEGYSWQHISFGRRQHYRRQFQAVAARSTGLRALAFKRHTMPGYRYELDTNRTLHNEWSSNLRILRNEFPYDLSAVLPTRFGNRIRASETYADREYHMNTITIWPRLIAVIDNDYATALDNAYISLSFMLNSSFLSAVMAFLILIVGLLYPIPLATPDFWIPWVLEIGVFVLLACVFYLWATDRASTWGRLMEGAVDLYRWKLLEQLGYTQRPDTKQAERKLWQKISDQMIIGDSLDGPHIDYREEV